MKIAKHHDKNNFIILLFMFLFGFCNKIGVRDAPIPVEQIFGTYDLYNGEIITLKSDYSYEHLYKNDSISKKDMGIWRYQSFDITKTNEIRAYDMRVLSENGEKNYYTEYITHYFYACKHWGKVIITPGYEGDPDGAPSLKWYKKIE